MTFDWTLLAPVMAAYAGVRLVLRSRRQYHDGEIERRHLFASVGGVLGAFWGSVYFGVGHPLMAAVFLVMFLPEAVVPERHYRRFEDWFMRLLATRKGRRRLEEFRERQASERAAELEFERRMKHPELAPGPPQGNDP